MLEKTDDRGELFILLPIYDSTHTMRRPTPRIDDKDGPLSQLIVNCFPLILTGAAIKLCWILDLQIA
jgi:hypothetical protein